MPANFNVALTATGFSGAWAHVNSREHLKATIGDLARATFCLGTRTLFDEGVPTLRQRALAAMHVTSAVAKNGKSLVLRRGHFEDDDQIRRTTVFMIGTAMAKLFSEQSLNAPWAIPVRHLVQVCDVSVAAKTKRVPDLVAHDRARHWHVLEAKGSSARRLPVLAHAKRQTATIRKINGDKPATRTACLSDLRESFQVVATDPEDDGGSLAFQLDSIAFLRHYYSWFLSEPRPTYEEEVGGARVVARTLDVSDQFKVGVVAKFIAWADRGFRGNAPTIRAHSGPGYSLGPDGVVFRYFRGAVEDWC